MLNDSTRLLVLVQAGPNISQDTKVVLLSKEGRLVQANYALLNVGQV